MIRRALLVGAFLLAGAAPAAACGTQQRNHAAGPVHLKGPAPWFIGDSTGILASPHMGRAGIRADAKACRQFDEGVAMIARRRRLPFAVVMALGANGDVGRAQLARARRAVGDDRFLVFVTPRNYPGSRRAMLAAARAHPDRVLTLDWTAESNGHGEWFFGDGLHPSFGGARVYARFVASGLRPFLGPPPLHVAKGRGEARACGSVRAYGRTTDVYVTWGDLDCKIARKRMRAPRMHPPRGWRFYDWRTVRHGPWTDILASDDRSNVVAGISR
jgi:hypothetical protein